VLHQLVPNATSIGVLVDPTSASAEPQTTDLQEAAKAFAAELVFLSVGNEQEIDAAFRSLVQRQIGALLLTDSTLFKAHREQLVTLARFDAVPTMFTFRYFAAAGGLISYAASPEDMAHRTGAYVARVLKGEKPGDLPVELATKFELVINLTTARALSIAVPETLLAVADEAIQ
jgi:putative ABC transport system substrate-binding protein